VSCVTFTRCFSKRDGRKGDGRANVCYDLAEALTPARRMIGGAG